MSNTPNLAVTVAWLSFAIAFVLGAISARTQFCTLGAVSDIVNMGDFSRMRMWVLGMAVAIVGAQALYAFGLIDLSKAFYVRPNVTWLSYLVGGLLFGIGMTLSSGCGSRTLVRIGGGNVKSLVVFVFLGISAYMTMKGLFGVWRVNYLDVVNVDLAPQGIGTQEFGALVGSMMGVSKKSAQIAIAAIVAAPMLVFVLAGTEFRRSLDGWLGGLGYGLAVVAGWYVSAHIGFGENPDTLEMVFFGTNSRTAESLTFVAPTAYSLELLMLWSDKSLIVTFGIASIAGMIAGSLAYALITKRFRWEGFANIDDTRKHILGATLMGFGGVTAMGCTIGQGMTGLSTLAVGSFLALAAIVFGCWATLKYEYWRLMQEG
ncbi:MAG: YeeE/YedE family protein [Betaproteobacteria bacterium]|nr:YeeE/YedE family protein [Betaproteobacteria bacterium]